MNNTSQSSFLNRIFIGATKRPYKLLITVVLTYTVIWSLLEPIISLAPELGEFLDGGTKLVSFVVLSIILGFIINSVPKKLEFFIENQDISIEFGNLFDGAGVKAIPVSRYMFETEVVPSSLQSLVINDFQASHEGGQGLQSYIHQLDESLKNIPYQLHLRSPDRGEERYYPFGTTVKIRNNDAEYWLFSLTQTELIGHIPTDNCTVVALWEATEAFWVFAKSYARGKDVNIPLIGGGVSGIKLPPTLLLELNLLIIKNHIANHGRITTGKIRVCLHESYVERIDLGDVKNIWIEQ